MLELKRHELLNFCPGYSLNQKKPDFKTSRRITLIEIGSTVYTLPKWDWWHDLAHHPKINQPFITLSRPQSSKESPKAHNIRWYYVARNLQCYSLLKLWSLSQCFRKPLYHYKRTDLIASFSVPFCSVVRPRENDSLDSDLINQCNFLWPHFHFSLKQHLHSRY